ncbi:M48 family metallopeptidase [Balneatrix alpica]|uniref:M48 family metallopeptidase n=1 Tax=Balneatrix alpica TaxID=75684 RepID=A0ABV5ZHU1_9GAMM|nr:M48 family metallopeptidase [Balneatrix alpica]
MKLTLSARVGLLALTASLLSACATSPLGRQQLQLFPAAQVEQMGMQSFAQIRQETKESKNAKTKAYVSCVAERIVAEIPPQYPRYNWEVVVFEADQVNAFALPGGKIGVYTGLLKVAEDQHQLAAVIGHEVAHVLARHANERISTQFATQTGLQLAQVAGGPQNAEMFKMLGVGAHYGIILPYGRTQESEADLLGLDLMASAGFNPAASLDLWRNMNQGGGPRPPELASTHPAPERRMQDLQARLQQVEPLYQQALASGRRPNCR